MPPTVSWLPAKAGADDDEREAEQQGALGADAAADPAGAEHRDAHDGEVAGEEERDLRRARAELVGDRLEDGVDEADAHEGDHAGEGDRPDGLGLAPHGGGHPSFRVGCGAGASAAAASSSSMTSMATRTRSSAGSVELVEGGGQDGQSGPAHALERGVALVAEGDHRGARVVGVGRAVHPARRLEALELGGDRRLAAVIGGREGADAGGSELVEQGEQPGLREGHVERRVPAGPARESRGRAQQVVAQGGRFGHSLQFT